MAVQQPMLIVILDIPNVELVDLDQAAKDRIQDLQIVPVRDIVNAGTDQWDRYGNTSNPKLPSGGDYQIV